MSVMAWDVETTGLPLFKERSHDPRQPHIVQLAMVTYNDDGTEQSARCVLIKPVGWVIPPDMTAIHGISQERAEAEGIPEDHAIALWVVAQARASLRVAHNSAFDTRLARIAMTRADYERDFIEAVETRASFCTCNSSKSIVNLPPTEKMVARGMNGPKSPSLAETMRYFFNEEIDGAHDALVDARCSGRIYWHLKGLEGAA